MTGFTMTRGPADGEPYIHFDRELFDAPEEPILTATANPIHEAVPRLILVRISTPEEWAATIPDGLLADSQRLADEPLARSAFLDFIGTEFQRGRSLNIFFNPARISTYAPRFGSFLLNRSS